MQEGFKQYCFTDNQEIALKFFAEENALLQIKKLPMLTGLSVIKLNSMEVAMQDEKYASVTQLIELAKQKKYNEMLSLLHNYTYSRYTISLCKKQLVNNDTPREISEIIMNYHESALATL